MLDNNRRIDRSRDLDRRRRKKIRNTRLRTVRVDKDARRSAVRIARHAPRATRYIAWLR